MFICMFRTQEGVLEVMRGIQGPFAFIFYNAPTNTLWYGRDRSEFRSGTKIENNYFVCVRVCAHDFLDLGGEACCCMLHVKVYINIYVSLSLSFFHTKRQIHGEQ